MTSVPVTREEAVTAAYNEAVAEDWDPDRTLAAINAAYDAGLRRAAEIAARESREYTYPSAQRACTDLAAAILAECSEGRVS